jgi:hypothetical protein
MLLECNAANQVRLCCYLSSVFVAACRLAEQAVRGGELAQARRRLSRNAVSNREYVLSSEGPLFHEVRAVVSCCMVHRYCRMA